MTFMLANPAGALRLHRCDSARARGGPDRVVRPGHHAYRRSYDRGRLHPEPATPRSAAAFPVLLMVMFINILGFGVVVPLLPFYGQSFHTPPWAIALVFSAYSLGSFFGEPFWGRLFGPDRAAADPDQLDQRQLPLLSGAGLRAQCVSSPSRCAS